MKSNILFFSELIIAAYRQNMACFQHSSAAVFNLSEVKLDESPFLWNKNASGGVFLRVQDYHTNDCLLSLEQSLFACRFLIVHNSLSQSTFLHPLSTMLLLALPP